jgi:hypothetical protein
MSRGRPVLAGHRRLGRPEEFMESALTQQSEITRHKHGHERTTHDRGCCLRSQGLIRSLGLRFGIVDGGFYGHFLPPQVTA